MKKEEIINGNLDRAVLDRIDDETVKIIANRFLFDLKEKLLHCNNGNCEIYPLAAAVAYVSYIKANNPKTLDEISALYDVQRRTAGRTIKKVKSLLGTRYCQTQTVMGTKCMVLKKPIDYIDEICNKMGLKNEVVYKCRKMAKELEENNNFIGKNPAFVGAGIVYVTCFKLKTQIGEITQRQVADAIGCTEVTLRSNSNLIKRIENEKRI